MDKRNHRDNPQEAMEADTLLQTLFRHADARQRPPAETERAVRGALEAHWRRRVSTRRNRRRAAVFGLAASVALVMLLTRPWTDAPTHPVSPRPVGYLVKQMGAFTLQTGEASPGTGQFHEQGALFAGNELATGHAARAAIRWMDQISIRLDQDTRIRLRGASDIELLAGGIYLDAGRRPSPERAGDVLSIHTAAGQIRHVGTQYLARFGDGRLEVSVREGRVAVSLAGHEALAGVGERVTIVPGTEPTHSAVSTWGSLWAWTEDAAPAIDLDGRTVLEFLQHVARESGHDLAFDDARAEDLARRSTLSGTVDLPPLEAMAVVLQTTDLTADTENGRILVHAR